MSDPQLELYILQQAQLGVPQETIESVLITSGWPKQEVQQAIKKISFSTHHATNNLPTFRTLVVETLAIYKRIAFKSLLMVLVPQITAGIYIFTYTLLILNFREAHREIMPGDPAYRNAAIQFLLLVIGGITFFVAIYSFVSTYIYTVLLETIAHLDEQFSLRTTLKLSWNMLLRTWLIVILVALILSISFIIFVIPGIIMLPWLLFAPYILIHENIGGVAALIRSITYVKSCWWQISWRYYLLILILACAVFVLSIPGLILEKYFDMGMVQMVFVFIGVPALILPILVIFTNILYIQFKDHSSPSAITKKQERIGIALILLLVSILPGFYLLQYYKPFARKERAAYAEWQADIKLLEEALETYNVKNNKLPKNLEELQRGGYIEEVPVSPYDNEQYEYKISRSGRNYIICTRNIKNGSICDPSDGYYTEVYNYNPLRK